MSQPIQTIRRAEKGDAQVLYNLLYDLAVYEKIEHEVTVTPEQLDADFFGETPHVEAFFAVADGKEVAVATVYYNYATFQGRKGCYLEDIFVSPQYRKRGLGKALMKAVARRALEKGCIRMEWIALDWNENALVFYKNLGAFVRDEWRLLRLEQPHLDKLAD
jgi:GNAT superfamily N-acetyltransferase